MDEMGSLKHAKYLILGGGLSGLGAAKALLDEDHLLLEKNNNLIGHANSVTFMNHSFDFGTHICHSKDNDWLDRINKEECNFFKDSIVKNYDRGRWVDYPVQNNLRHLPKDKAELALKELEQLQSSIPNNDNYLEWSRSVYGSFLTENYYKRFTDKYWRTDMAEMSTDWFSGRILPTNIQIIKDGFKEKPKSQAVFKSFYYPKKSGFSNFFKHFHEKVNYEVGKNVMCINPDNKIVYTDDGSEYKYEILINTLPLNQIPHLISAPEDALIAAKKLKYLNLITTAAVIEGEENYKKFPHWFYIYDKDIEMARVTNISRISNKQDQNLALQFETFRRNDEEYDRIELEKQIEKQCSSLLGSGKSIKFKHFYSQYSYVLSLKDTKKIRKYIINLLDKKNIHTCGLYGSWEYMWSDKSFMSGFNKAKTIANKFLK